MWSRQKRVSWRLKGRECRQEEVGCEKGRNGRLVGEEGGCEKLRIGKSGQLVGSKISLIAMEAVQGQSEMEKTIQSTAPTNM